MTAVARKSRTNVCPQSEIEDLERRVDPLDVLELRAWARAYLWAIGELELREAVDVLWRDAERDGLAELIGMDTIQEILATAFEKERQKKQHERQRVRDAVQKHRKKNKQKQDAVTVTDEEMPTEEEADESWQQRATA